MDSNLVIIGDLDSPLMEFDSSNITSCTCTQEMHPTGEELPISTAEITIKTAGFVGLFCPSDYEDGMEGSDGAAVVCKAADGTALESIPLNTKVWVYRNGDLLGKYYVSKITQQSANEYQISCEDWVGVLDNYTFYGLFNTTPLYLSTILTQIRFDAYSTAKNQSYTRYADDHPITDIYNSFVIDDDNLASLMVFQFYKGGCTLREYMQRALFTWNIMARQDENGDIILSSYPSSKGSTADETLEYNEASREQQDHVSTISVTEYGYYQDSDTEYTTVYDTTDTGSADDYAVITLERPAFGEIDASTISYSAGAANGYITVHGYGKVQVQYYTQTTRQVSVRDTDESALVDGSDISIDNPAVTAQNSDLILTKLENYYFNRPWSNTVSTAEHIDVGTNLEFTDSVGDTQTGFLAANSMTLSGKMKTDMTLYTGYDPTSGMGYSHSTVLTGSGTFTVPEEVFDEDTPMIRVILIGGGQGGSNGCKGMDGRTCSTVSSGAYVTQEYVSIASDTAAGQVCPTISSFSYEKSGACGNRGDDGAGGSVTIVTITNPSASYSYSCGTGGAGADGGNTSETDSTEGSLGTASTFGSYTSAGGEVAGTGYKDPITSKRYALGADKARTYESLNGICGTNQFDCDTMTGCAPFYLCNGDSSSWWWWGNMSSYFISSSSAMDSDNMFYAFSKSAYGAKTQLMHNAHGADAVATTLDGVSVMGGNGGGAGAGNDGGDGTASVLTKKSVTFGNGGNGGDSTWQPPKITDIKADAYGFGGIGGFGGGGGGHTGFGYGSASSSAATAGTPGTGGCGGPGGDGGDGCVIVLY